jgi:EthD domain
MFKFVIGGRRRAGMTHREYSRYAQVVHGGSVIASASPRIERYIQSHVLDAAYGTEQSGWHPAPDFDSFSELWFADAAAMQAELASEAYQTRVKPDEPHFTDAGRILVMGCREEEQPVTTLRNGRLKIMRFMKRVNGISAEQFTDAWRKETARIAEHPVIGAALCRFVRSHAITSAAQAVGQADEQFVRGTPVNVYDALESAWFPAFDDIDVFDLYRNVIKERDSYLKEILDRRAEIILLAEERQILPVERPR